MIPFADSSSLVAVAMIPVAEMGSGNVKVGVLINAVTDWTIGGKLVSTPAVGMTGTSEVKALTNAPVTD